MMCKENMIDSSALIAYTYKCFVLSLESKLIAYILKNAQTNSIIRSMDTMDESKTTAETIRQMKDALIKAHIFSNGREIVFWDGTEEKKKYELKISADKLSELVCALYKNKQELQAV